MSRLKPKTETKSPKDSPKNIIDSNEKVQSTNLNYNVDLEKESKLEII